MSLYIVTVENDEDGVFHEDPAGFDTLHEAREYARKQPIPNGHVVAIYSCDLIESFEPSITSGQGK